jgi:hypothetical protein
VHLPPLTRLLLLLKTTAMAEAMAVGKEQAITFQGKVIHQNKVKL